MLTLSRSCFPDSRTNKGPVEYRSSDQPENEADLSDKGISSLDEVSKICAYFLSLIIVRSVPYLEFLTHFAIFFLLFERCVCFSSQTNS
jgi:hypothetical protein